MKIRCRLSRNRKTGKVRLKPHWSCNCVGICEDDEPFRLTGRLLEIWFGWVIIWIEWSC
jgi:hypothetical protein